MTVSVRCKGVIKLLQKHPFSFPEGTRRTKLQTIPLLLSPGCSFNGCTNWLATYDLCAKVTRLNMSCMNQHLNLRTSQSFIKYNYLDKDVHICTNCCLNDLRTVSSTNHFSLWKSLRSNPLNSKQIQRGWLEVTDLGESKRLFEVFGILHTGLIYARHEEFFFLNC